MLNILTNRYKILEKEKKTGGTDVDFIDSARII